MPATFDEAKNHAKATVVGFYDENDTTIQLADGHGVNLPAAPFSAYCWDSNAYPDPSDDPNVEIFRITAKNVDTLTVIRGAEQSLGGKPPSTKSTATGVYLLVAGITAGFVDNIRGAVVDVGEDTIWVTEHGAVGDGSTDDLAEIQAAIDAGKTILFPPGTFAISGDLVLKSDLVLKGSGVGVTTIKLLAASGATHMFTGTNLVRVKIQDLTVEGNEANNGSALDAFHFNGAARVDIVDVEIKEVRQNGISLGNDSGTNQYVCIRNVRISSCRGHLIEICNRGSTNIGVQLSNLVLATPGVSSTAKAAIMAFGKVQMTNIWCDSVAGDNYGIWLRDDDGTFGNGAHDSELANCHVRGTSGSGTITEGFKIDSDRCAFSNCTSDSLDRNFRVVGDDNRFVGCSANAGDAGFYLEGDRFLIQGCHIATDGSGKACIDVRSGADNGRIFNNRINATSSASKVIVSGANLHARDNEGWVTHAVLESADIDVSSNGEKQQTISHSSLNVTPLEKDILIGVYRSVGTGVFGTRGSYVEDVTGGNIIVSFNVTALAASTSARVVLFINCFP